MAFSTSTSRIVFPLVAVGAWAGAQYGALELHRAEGLIGHAICGPWGCGPTVESLVGYHVFWALLIWPPVLLVAARLSPGRARALGLGLLVAGASGALGVMTWAAIDWLVTSTPVQQKYVLQRAPFVLATSVDLPVLQIAMAGLLAWGSARRRLRRTPADRPQPFPSAASGNRAGP